MKMISCMTMLLLDVVIEMVVMIRDVSDPVPNPEDSHALARSPSRNTRGQMKDTGMFAVVED